MDETESNRDNLLQKTEMSSPRPEYHKGKAVREACSVKQLQASFFHLHLMH